MNTEALLDKKRLTNAMRFFLLLRPYWRNIVVFILCDIVLTLMNLPFPWFTKIMIDDVMLKQDDSLLTIIVATVFLLTLTRIILDSLRTYYVEFCHNLMEFDISFSFFQHLQKLSFSFYDNHEVPEILARFRDATSSRETLIDILNSIVTNLLYLLIVPFIVFMMNWQLALIAGFTLPWMAFSFFILSRFVKKYSLLSAQKQAEMSTMNYENLSGIREIQSLGNENLFMRRLKRLYLQNRKLDMFIGVFSNVEGLIGGIMTALGTLLYTWYGAKLVISGQMTVGELTAFTVFVGYLYNPLTEIVGLLVPIQEVSVSTQRFYEYYDIQPSTAEIKRPKTIGVTDYEIIFSNVCFGYSPERLILQNINLAIPAGSTLAITGSTGSGKSTLIDLLPRFHEPQKGEIIIGGNNIRELSLKNLRSHIGSVRQSPFLFNGSIKDNICGGRPDFTEKQIIKAATKAQVHKFINKLPNGYDTPIGEQGVMLSGGEKQRIALARVFLYNCPILVLDEATSNLDTKTEAEVLNVLNHFKKEKTTIIIAHRLSSIKEADHIIVMENGQIVEQGKHQELLRNKSFYYQLH
jgi:ABC-type bacteriocin/lantibiotic exporter with double-glycine peptidase domain